MYIIHNQINMKTCISSDCEIVLSGIQLYCFMLNILNVSKIDVESVNFYIAKFVTGC
jgi:hypothetical protein